MAEAFNGWADEAGAPDAGWLPFEQLRQRLASISPTNYSSEVALKRPYEASYDGTWFTGEEAKNRYQADTSRAIAQRYHMSGAFGRVLADSNPEPINKQWLQNPDNPSIRLYNTPRFDFGKLAKASPNMESVATWLTTQSRKVQDSAREVARSFWEEKIVETYSPGVHSPTRWRHLDERPLIGGLGFDSFSFALTMGEHRSNWSRREVMSWLTFLEDEAHKTNQYDDLLDLIAYAKGNPTSHILDDLMNTGMPMRLNNLDTFVSGSDASSRGSHVNRPQLLPR